MVAPKGPQTPELPKPPVAPAARGGLRLSLAALVLAWGMQAIVTQSLLLREAMVLMYGSEFAWGIVLFAWLLGIAFGAALGGRLAGVLLQRGSMAGVLVGVLLLLSLAAGLDLWVFRGARAWLEIAPGELLPLAQTIVAALLFVSPVSALVGVAFPLACSVRRAAAPVVLAGDGSALPFIPALSFGQVYALESAGSLLGGAAFSFWAVEHLAPVQITLWCGAVTAATSATFLITRPDQTRAADRRRWHAHLAAGTLASLAIVGVVTATVFGNMLDRSLLERRWNQLAPGYELVTTAESRYQNLALTRRAGQYSLYCDGHVASDFPDPYTYAPLAHFWMCQHPAPRRILLLGGGSEGLLSEILRHPIERVDCVEPDALQIDLVKPYLSPADQDALADPRVTLHTADARQFVKMQRAQFDVVLLRLPEPTSALRARFYTDEFYAELRRAMTPESVLCLTAVAAPTELSELAREYLASIRAALRRHFPELIVGWGDPAQVLAASTTGLITVDPALMAARYVGRGVASPTFDPAWFAGATDSLDPHKLTQRATDLDAARRVLVSTDLRPSIYLQRLALWEAASASSSTQRLASDSRSWTNFQSPATVFARLRSFRLSHVGGALILLGALTVLISRIRRGAADGWATGVVNLTVASTGFSTMALSILWLFAFQNLYGYVYQRIGWIIATFMAGLVIGCVLGGRGTTSFWRRLMWVAISLGLLATAVPVVWHALAALQTGPATFAAVEVCISTMVLLTGLLGGATITLAGRIQLTLKHGPSRAAGTIVSVDHAGACLGALACGIILVPVFGVLATSLLLGVANFGSALALRLTRR